MKVSFINLESALMKMEEIHRNVDHTDEFEKDIYNQILEISEVLVDAYDALEVPKKEIEADLRNLLDIYFEASDKFKMKE